MWLSIENNQRIESVAKNRHQQRYRAARRIAYLRHANMKKKSKISMKSGVYRK
jgi:hypothetical protein